MKLFSTFSVLVLLCAGQLTYADPQLELSGVSEREFNPTRGRLRANLLGATMADTADAVEVFINDRRVDDDAITIRDHSIMVDFQFVDGVNDVLIKARSTQGESLRADALLWAGDQTLIVDVVDAEMRPVDNAHVIVSLSSTASVTVDAVAPGGTARFANLPAAPIVITARYGQGEGKTVASRGDAGSVLITLD